MNPLHGCESGMLAACARAACALLESLRTAGADAAATVRTTTDASTTTTARRVPIPPHYGATGDFVRSAGLAGDGAAVAPDREDREHDGDPEAPRKRDRDVVARGRADEERSRGVHHLRERVVLCE